ncbi:hypothetical protein [Nocardia sp. IFM 10818]
MENFAAFNRPMVTPDGQLLVNLAVRADVPVNLISTDDISALCAAHPDLMDFRAWLHTSGAAAELIRQIRGGLPPAAV